MEYGSSCSNGETDDSKFITVDAVKGITVEDNEELTVLSADGNNCNETDYDSSCSSTMYNCSSTMSNILVLPLLNSLF